MAKIDWEIKAFQNLTVIELFEILHLRTSIFVVEQNCAYQEVDNVDPQSYHVFGKQKDGDVIAVARIVPPGISYKEISVGRVAIKKEYRGKGIGGLLLARSIQMTKAQGCTAGLAHIWMQSPGNSAFRYMSRAGGRVIKEHPDRWHESSVKDGYNCIICGQDCHCVAAEMLLEF